MREPTREPTRAQRDTSGSGDDECPEALREVLRQRVNLGADARARLDAALRAAPRPRPAPPLLGAGRWLLRPVRLPVPPRGMGAAAAALLLAGVFAGERLARTRAGTGAGTGATIVATAAQTGASADGTQRGTRDTVRLVRFVLVAPEAGRVSLVGDFNAWDAARTPMRAAGDGVWTVELPVGAGRHLYAFVVDGTRWVADPTAPLAPEDDFGARNSVLVVGAET